ncbi:hypothetical protein AB0L75_02075 [Streptomyces sp. NPDC052101]|uniref:hypothetical protein n=1 Tax=Streptomyces sp. NPDC052101 TaxID=3155763 RepID=UPI00343DC890
MEESALLVDRQGRSQAMSPDTPRDGWTRRPEGATVRSGVRAHRIRRRVPQPLSEDQLAAVRTPLYLLPTDHAERANRLMPDFMDSAESGLPTPR